MSRPFKKRKSEVLCAAPLESVGVMLCTKRTSKYGVQRFSSCVGIEFIKIATAFESRAEKFKNDGNI